MSFCLETYLQQNDDYKILIQRSGVKQCYKLIEDNAKEIIHVNPGDKVLGARLIGLPPIPVGINEEEGTILITYTKPCHGTAAIEIPISPEEIADVRAMDIGVQLGMNRLSKLQIGEIIGKLDYFFKLFLNIFKYL